MSALEPGKKKISTTQVLIQLRTFADVLMTARVGDDLFGADSLRNFKELGIDARHVKTVPGVATGVASIFVDADANNRILIVKGANGRLSPADIDEAADDLALCGALVLQLEIPLPAVYRAIRFGAERGIPVILNPAPAALLDFDAIRDAAFFVPNETELESISGMPAGTVEQAGAAARSLLDKGMRNILVTLGAKGSLWVSRGGVATHVPPCAAKAVDTTGAGDASTERPGAQKSYPTSAEFAAMTR